MPQLSVASVAHVSHDHAGDDPEHEEAEARVAEELLRTRERLLAEPAEQVVVNHAIGLYELGAIHLLSATPPNLPEAALAIDALACLVEGLQGRLGENEAVLRDALANIRVAFVQVKAQQAPEPRLSVGPGTIAEAARTGPESAEGRTTHLRTLHDDAFGP